jgi:hypothetical protein
MNADLDLSTILVADLLKSSTGAVRFFLNQKTECATCLLARFCSLQDVVHAYRLDRQAFTDALARIDVPTPKRGDFHETIF